MRIHVHKKAIRALGISESFQKGKSQKSVLAGTVMRADYAIDGFIFSEVTVGGMDATEKIIGMFQSLARDDINLLMLNGCIISWYNVVDLQQVHEATARPLICVTYEESEGLEKYFTELFPEDSETRIAIYHKNAERTPIQLKTGYTIYARFLGLTQQETKQVLNRFTTHGAVPEPLRVTKILAAATFKTMRHNDCHEH